MNRATMKKAEESQPRGRHPAPVSKAGDECTATAIELLEVLKEEAAILRRFAGGELPALLSKKEFLVSEFGEKLGALKTCGDAQGPGAVSLSPALRRLIGGIRDLNESNRCFISNTLGYWQDFIAALFPPNYGRSPDQTKSFLAGIKGLSFSREA